MRDFNRFLEAIEQGNLASVADSLAADASLVTVRDQRGATALHYATLHGHKAIARALIEHGAAVNAFDEEFGATPAGWAIEYLRELGGFLATELDDLAFAIRHHDVRWVRRLLDRFPALRDATDSTGIPVARLAAESGDAEIAHLFDARLLRQAEPRQPESPESGRR
jgi:ankyrin repeat protein